MILTVRLKQEEKRLLERAEKRYGKARSRSALVREAVVKYWGEKLARPQGSLYDALKGKVGVIHSGRRDLSMRSGELFYKALLVKHKRSR